MRLWRIGPAAYAPSCLEGVGGLYVGGRWHRVGVPVVYCATHPALAALEVLVHTDWSTAPADMVLVELHVPDDAVLERLDPASLPVDWRVFPAPPSTQEAGTSWLLSRRSLALEVPSVVAPGANVLLNPRHRDIARCRIVSAEPFAFDERLRPPP